MDTILDFYTFQGQPLVTIGDDLFTGPETLEAFKEALDEALFMSRVLMTRDSGSSVLEATRADFEMAVTLFTAHFDSAEVQEPVQQITLTTLEAPTADYLDLMQMLDDLCQPAVNSGPECAFLHQDAVTSAFEVWDARYEPRPYVDRSCPTLADNNTKAMLKHLAGDQGGNIRQPEGYIYRGNQRVSTGKAQRFASSWG